MKLFRVIFVIFLPGTLLGVEPASVSVSKGAAVEGLFILQNKNLDIKKAIQDLKKELTECFGKPEKGSQGSGQSQSYDQYHCKLRQVLYPTYIDELGVLSAALEKNSALINGAQPVSKTVFEGIMHKASLASEKIDHEKKLLSKIFEVDRKEYELALLHKERVLKESARQAMTDLTTSIRMDKEEVTRLKSRIVSINKELFTGDLKQEVYLDKLSFRRK